MKKQTKIRHGPAADKLSKKLARRIEGYVLIGLGHLCERQQEMIDEVQDILIHPDRNPHDEKRVAFVTKLIREQGAYMGELVKDLGELQV